MNTASGVAPAAQLSLEVGADEPPLLRHLWRLRTAQGLSQEELADRAGSGCPPSAPSAPGRC